MPTPQSSDRAALGRARLAERARRVSRIRRTVVAATLCAFALAWGVIVFDGPMGATTTVASTSGTAATSSPTTAVDPTSTYPDQTSSSSGNGSPPAVTTSQS
jgi:hypothetical protein